MEATPPSIVKLAGRGWREFFINKSLILALASQQHRALPRGFSGDVTPWVK